MLIFFLLFSMLCSGAQNFHLLCSILCSCERVVLKILLFYLSIFTCIIKFLMSRLFYLKFNTLAVVQIVLK